MMNIKRKLILSISGIVIGLALIFAIKFILDATYRNQLPAYPNFNTISKPLQEQIKNANNQAYLLTTADNLGILGMVYYSSGYNEKASLCFQLAHRKNSSNWIWSYYLGVLNLEQGELNTAIENFKEVVLKDPRNYLAYYYCGEAYQKLGMTNDAENIFKFISNQNDNSVVDTVLNRENYFPLKTYAKFQLARIYLNSNRLDSSEIILKEIIDDQMRFGPAYRTLGNVYTMKNDLPLANKYITRANDLADYTPPTDNLVDKMVLLSRSDEFLLKQIDNAVRSSNYHWALKLCDIGLKYFPDNKYLVSKAIIENFRQGNDQKALSYLDEHYKFYNNDCKELMDFTDLLYNKGHGEEALKYFNQVKKLMPPNSSLAMWLYERGKKKEAIKMMNDLVKKDPKNVKFQSDIIRLLLNMGDDDVAKEYFSNLKRNSPSDPETLKITGLMAEKEGNMKEAFSIYEQALKADPKDLIFIKELTSIYIREKMWEQAVNHFKMALAIFPNEPMLLEGYGRLLLACPDSKFKNINEGIEYSERAFININSVYDTQLSAGKSLATAYVFLGNKKKAIKFINMTVKLAEAGNKGPEYITYFKSLVAKKA